LQSMGGKNKKLRTKKSINNEGESESHRKKRKKPGGEVKLRKTREAVLKVMEK